MRSLTRPVAPVPVLVGIRIYGVRLRSNDAEVARLSIGGALIARHGYAWSVERKTTYETTRGRDKTDEREGRYEVADRDKMTVLVWFVSHQGGW